MSLSLSYRRVLFTTTALVAISLTSLAHATDVTPAVGADTTLNTANSADGYNFIAGGDNNFNTGNTTAVVMDNATSAGQVVTLTGPGVTVTAANANTIFVADDAAQITIGAGNILSNTGTGDTINFGTVNNALAGFPAVININGTLSNTGGGQAINTGSVLGGTVNINLNSTTGVLNGDLAFGTGATNFNVTGNGTNSTTGNITGTTGTDTINVNLGATGNSVTLGGVLTNIDVLNANTGTTILGGNIVGGGTVNVAAGAGLNIAGVTSVAATGATNVNGVLTTAATAILNSNLNLNSTTGSISGPLQLGNAGYTTNVTGTGANALASSFTGGTGNDILNINLTGAGNTFTNTGAIYLGVGSDIINIQQGTLSAGNNVTTETTILGANGGAGLNVTAGIYSGGDIISAANANAKSVTVNGGTLLNNINLTAATGTNTIALNSGVFNGSYTGGTGADNLTIGNIDLNGAINGGAGADSVNFTGGAHTNAITNVESLALTNSGTTYANGTALTGITNALNVGAGTILTANNNINGAGSAFTFNGRTNVGSANNITVGSLAGGTVGAGSIYGVTINGLTQASSIVLATGNANLTNLGVRVTQANNTFINNGTQYQILTNAGAGTLTLPTQGVVPENSFVYRYTLTAGGTGNDLILTAFRDNMFDQSASNDQNRAIGQALEAYGRSGGTNPELLAINANLNVMPDAASTDRALESLKPATNGIGEATLATMNSALNTIGNRFNSYRNEMTGKNRGVSTGDNTSYVSGSWLQGFGTFIDQDRRDNVAGFDSTTGGASFGLDTEKLVNNGLAGVSFTYAGTTVNSDALNNAKTDIDTYQIGAYMTKNIDPKGDNYFIDGQVAFAYNRFDESRTIAVGAFNAPASGDYNGYQGSARVAVGKDFAVKDAKGLWLTPDASVQYTHASTDSYTETGAGGASLNVGDNDSDALIFGAGGRVSYAMNVGQNYQIVPEVRAHVLYDVIGDEFQTTNTFTGGGPAFRTNGVDPANVALAIGTGISLANLDKGTTLRVDYDAELKSDYVGHNVQARLRVEF